MKKFMKSIVPALFLAASMAHAEESVTIVAENDWYPYCADRNGKSEGFAVDVVEAAFKAAGVKLTLKSMPYARGMEEVKKGTEVGVFNTSKNQELEKEYIFHTNELFTAKIVIMAPANSTDSGLTTKLLEGKSVGVTNGYTYGNEFDSNKAIKKDPGVDDKTILKKLAAGRTQYAVIYDQVAKSLIAENKADLDGKLKQVGQVSEDKLYISFSKTNKDGAKFAALFDKGIETIKKNGEYKKIEEKWAAKLK